MCTVCILRDLGLSASLLTLCTSLLLPAAASSGRGLARPLLCIALLQPCGRVHDVWAVSYDLDLWLIFLAHKAAGPVSSLTLCFEPWRSTTAAIS